MQKILDIQKNLIDTDGLNLVETFGAVRKFVKEGELIKIREKKQTKIFLFLFNDLLLITKPKPLTDKFQLRRKFVLTSTKVEDLPEGECEIIQLV